ncbi:MAG TPA: sulfocyanin-like copper-binding protein [Chloroflexota bacterium]|nr:sulfocyanin-like copper-binding protein [Chloroflexota bacterium]
MASFITHPRLRLIAPLALCAAILSPAAALAASPRAPVWATYNPTTRTAHLTVISAYGQDTYNFNGGTNGHFVFTVPLGSKVMITYSNASTMMLHGMEIVKWTGKLPLATIPRPAFPGAASPNYRHGTPSGVTQTVRFTASKAGRYLLICPVRNHVKFGHWAWFIVSRTATTATGVLK